jgi:hypothetical protein
MHVFPMLSQGGGCKAWKFSWSRSREGGPDDLAKDEDEAEAVPQ